ncbi:steroid transmembrane transporter SLC22A24-like isoform X3 [Dermacentor albipictus]|uniref:steroid transmembrane transporter SLC22A24-like isoform X3 n=1 Tax=Dermacentor albipictus TaxID=60249 RepID=UPI0038FC1FA7
MEFEDVIEELGGFGKFQKFLLWGFLLPSEILFPFFSMNLIFLLSEPDHQCVVPQLDALGLNESRAQEIRKLLVSDDECAVLPMRDFNSTRLVTAVGFEATSWNASWFVNDSAPRQPCQLFRYDDLLYEETVPTKWDLICSRGHLPSLLYSTVTAASVIGPVIIGALADKYGRKPTFFAIVALAALSGFGAVLSTNFAMFVVMRFVNALLDPQIEQVPYIIIMELLDAKQRTLMLGVACMGWTLGMCLLTLVAYLSRTWVLLATVCASCVVPLFCYIRVIPESPRWLLSQDRLPEASAVLRRIAFRNGVEPPIDLDLKLKVCERLRVQRPAHQRDAPERQRVPQLSLPGPGRVSGQRDWLVEHEPLRPALDKRLLRASHGHRLLGGRHCPHFRHGPRHLFHRGQVLDHGGLHDDVPTVGRAVPHAATFLLNGCAPFPGRGLHGVGALHRIRGEVRCLDPVPIPRRGDNVCRYRSSVATRDQRIPALPDG